MGKPDTNEKTTVNSRNDSGFSSCCSLHCRDEFTHFSAQVVKIFLSQSDRSLHALFLTNTTKTTESTKMAEADTVVLGSHFHILTSVCLCHVKSDTAGSLGTVRLPFFRMLVRLHESQPRLFSRLSSPLFSADPSLNSIFG